MSFLERFFANERLTLDRQARQGLSGELAQLSDGTTYYEIAGPAKGKPVVLIHGFSVPNFIWDPTFAALAEAGFRVVRYDLYGRGWSSRPKVRYDRALFVRQLAELMDAVGFADSSLVSLSMGGVIAAEFAYRFPRRVSKLAFVDPAGFDLDLPLVIRLLNVPGLGELMLGVMDRFGRGTMLDSMLADFYQPSPEAIASFSSRYLKQMEYRGFKRAILSSLRTGMLEEDLSLYERVANLSKPTLLIWGKQDQTVPFRHAARFMKLVPAAEFHPIDNARHIPHFERPELVNPVLINFLSP
jgi:pimeloyl-ACP methyl ester carboxylesterase